jgi:hypothetical protein
MGKISETQDRLVIVVMRREEEETKNALEQSYWKEREHMAVSELANITTQVEDMSKTLLKMPERDARTSDEINEEVTRKKGIFDVTRSELATVQQQRSNRVYDLRLRKAELTNAECLVRDTGIRLREASVNEHNAMTRYLRINDEFLSFGRDLRYREGTETNEDRHRLISIGTALTLAKREHNTTKEMKEEAEEVWTRVSRELNVARQVYKYTKGNLKSISETLVTNAERKAKAAEEAYEEAQERLRVTCAEILCERRTTSSTRLKIHEKQQEMTKVKEEIARIQNGISEGTARVLVLQTEEAALNTRLSHLNSTLLDLESLLGRLHIARGVLSDHDAEFAALVVHDVMTGPMGEAGVSRERMLELWKEHVLSIHTQMERLVLLARTMHIEEERDAQSSRVKRSVDVTVGGDPKRMRDL